MPEASSAIQVGKGAVLMNGYKVIAFRESLSRDYSHIDPKCTLFDADFHDLRPRGCDLPSETTPLKIGDNVWVGSEVFVLKGVHIGQDCIVDAKSIVMLDLKNGAIAVGNPARVIGSVYA